MELHNLPASTTKKNKRIGRGYGSGVGGHTVGRGSKGQRSRVGRGIPLWFEGGQLPFVKRLPYLRGKLRFEALNDKPQLVRLTALEKLLVKEITVEVLFKHKLIRSVRLPVKVTGDGTLTRALSLKGLQATASAKKAIEKAGGTLA